MISLTPLAVPNTIGVTSASLDCASITMSQGITVQLSGAATTDAVDLYGSNLATISALSQAKKIGSIPSGGGNGQGPVQLSPPPYLYLYAVRTGGVTAGLTLTVTGEATSGEGTVTGVTATLPITSSGGNTPNIAINPATDSTSGSMSAADKTKLDNLGAAQVTYQPGGTPGNGVYTTWATAWAAVLLLSNPFMNIDGSLGSPVVPAGTYDLPQQITFNGLDFPTLTIDDGASFVQSAGGSTVYFTNVEIVSAATTASPFVVPSGDFFSVVAFVSELDCTGSLALFELTGTGGMFFLAYGETEVNGSSGHPIFNNTGSGTTNVIISQNSNISSDTFLGAWTVTQADPSCAYNSTQAGGTVTFKPANGSNNPTAFFTLQVTLTAGGPTTVASGKNLTNATLVGVYLVTPTTAVGVPQVTFVAGPNGNVTVESFGPGATKLVTDASTYACVFAGAF